MFQLPWSNYLGRDTLKPVNRFVRPAFFTHKQTSDSAANNIGSDKSRDNPCRNVPKLFGEQNLSLIMTNLYVRCLFRSRQPCMLFGHRFHPVRSRWLSSKVPNEANPDRRPEPPTNQMDSSKEGGQDIWKNPKSLIQDQILRSQNWLQNAYSNWKQKDGVGTNSSKMGDPSSQDGNEWYICRFFPCKFYC